MKPNESKRHPVSAIETEALFSYTRLVKTLFRAHHHSPYFSIKALLPTSHETSLAPNSRNNPFTQHMKDQHRSILSGSVRPLGASRPLFNAFGIVDPRHAHLAC